MKRFVHVGTEAALVDGNALVNADETWPLKPDSRAYYPRSKARAEQMVVAANGDGGMETVVVRPRFVWGPGDTTLLPGIVELIRAGKFAWVGGGDNPPPPRMWTTSWRAWCWPPRRAGAERPTSSRTASRSRSGR